MGGPSIRQRRMPKDEEPPRETVGEEFRTQLARHIDHAWERNKRAKLKVERRMLRSLRQRDRQYEADIYAAIKDQGGSEHYDGLTATKCRAAEAWIEDAIFPLGDRPWDVKPTPIPEISPQIKQHIQQQAMQAAVRETLSAEEAGIPVPDIGGLTQLMEFVSEQVEQTYNEVSEEEAKEKAINMGRQIDDQFHEGNFYSELKALIKDFVTFPAAFVEGPVMHRRKMSKYEQIGGKWYPRVGYRTQQEYRRVSGLDVYPEDDAESVEDGDLFVRRRYASKELGSFRNVKGYDTEAIDAVLASYAEGGYRNWTVIDQARAQAEGREGQLHESSKIDALKFWGSVQGQWLIDHSVNRNVKINLEDIDPFEHYEIEAIKIGEYIIRAILNPDKLGRRNLSKASFEEKPGSFWGNGVPDLIRHDQNACNAVARAIANNTAMSSGPLTEWNIDRLIAATDRRLVPWMSIESTDEQLGSNVPAVRFTNVPNNTDQMLRVWDKFLQRADENSGVPAYAHGAEDVGGAGNTASGLSMLMSSSAKMLRLAIFNLDVGIIEPTVRRQYQYNMLFLEDESIKGDLRVVPRGAMVLLVREQMAARQGEFADSTNNPIDYALMGPDGRRELRRAQAKNLNFEADMLFPDNPSQTQLPLQQSGQPQTNTQGGVNQGSPSRLDQAGRPMKDLQRQ